MEAANIMMVMESYLQKSGKGENYIAKKVTQLFEGANSPLNLERGVLLKFKEAMKGLNKNVEKVSKASEKFVEKLKTLDKRITEFTKALNIKEGAKINLPNFKDFMSVMDGTLTKMRDMRNNIRVGILKTFFKNLKTLNPLLKRASTIISKGLEPGGKENAVRSSSEPISVKIVDISGAAKKLLKGLTSKVSVGVNTGNRERDEEKGSLLGSLLKGLIGLAALTAGIGFISKFLDESPMGKVIKQVIGDMKDKVVKFITPYFRKLMEYVKEGIKVIFVDLTTWFMKQTFNFYGLKEMLGAENEGLAVIITKAIYYGIKNVVSKTLNFFSGGVLKMMSDQFYKAVGKVGELTSFIGAKVSGVFKWASDAVFKMFKGDETKFIPKMFGKLSGFMGGGIFKLLGTGLKQIGKRIPFIGAAISLYDAYQRLTKGDITGGLISIGSGIASFFPGIGTAISIGLDVLNAVLDSKQEGQAQPKGKLAILGEMFSGLWEGFINIFDGIFKGIWDMMKNVGKSIWDWITGKKKETDKTLDSEQKKAPVPQPNPPTPNPETAPTPYVLATRQAREADAKSQVALVKATKSFDVAFKDVNKKLDSLVSVFAEGVQLLATTSAQGSNSVVNAVMATGSSKNQSSPMVAASDAIGDFRRRAAIAIESVTR